MLLAVYITLTTISFSLLVIGFLLTEEKIIGKSALFGLSMVLFGLLASSSFAVETIDCTSTACTKTSHFYGVEAWLFAALAAFSALMTFITALLGAKAIKDVFKQRGGV